VQLEQQLQFHADHHEKLEYQEVRAGGAQPQSIEELRYLLS
jgi:hypothetical protein